MHSNSQNKGPLVFKKSQEAKILLGTLFLFFQNISFRVIKTFLVLALGWPLREKWP